MQIALRERDLDTRRTERLIDCEMHGRKRLREMIHARDEHADVEDQRTVACLLYTSDAADE